MHFNSHRSGKRRERAESPEDELLGGDITQSKAYKAVGSGTIEALEEALQAKPKPSREIMSVCLFRAVADGDASKVAILLKHGASVHSIDAGQTPLHRCLSWADISDTAEIEPVVRVLVAAGADKEAQDDDGLTALGYCHDKTQAALANAFDESRSLDEVMARINRLLAHHTHPNISCSAFSLICRDSTHLFIPR